MRNSNGPLADVTCDKCRGSGAGCCSVMKALRGSLDFVAGNLSFSVDVSFGGGFNSAGGCASNVSACCCRPGAKHCSRLNRSSPFHFDRSGGASPVQHAGLRLGMNCKHDFNGRGVGSVLICGRRGAADKDDVPDTLVKCTTHMRCNFTSGCLNRIDLKCGNSRGFTGNRHFKFFPSNSLKCIVSRRTFVRGIGGIVPCLGMENSINLINGSGSGSHFLCVNRFAKRNVCTKKKAPDFNFNAAGPSAGKNVCRGEGRGGLLA